MWHLLGSKIRCQLFSLVKSYKSGQLEVSERLNDISLYKFTSSFTDKWSQSRFLYVPHSTKSMFLLLKIKSWGKCFAKWFYFCIILTVLLTTCWVIMKLLRMLEEGMVCLGRLAHINRRLKPEQQELPFGGITVLISGDFRQLPPVLAFALYSETVGTKFQWEGRVLYRLYNISVCLKQSLRQIGDKNAETGSFKCPHAGVWTTQLLKITENIWKVIKSWKWIPWRDYWT